MDIVVITRDRPELLEQTIRSMRANAADWSKHRLVTVFDGSLEEARVYFGSDKPNCLADRIGGSIKYTGKQLGVGGAKNFGAAHIERQLEIFNKLDPPVKLQHAPNSLLMFSDGDMYYLPGWDARLESAMDCPDWALSVTQVGGWRHPYHGLGKHLAGWAIFDPQGSENELYEVDAATGNCFVIRWQDWLKYGPFDAVALGPGQSEDYALSQRIKQGGGVVATLDPPVAIHCGLVNSSGEPATGWRECEEQVTEQLAALSADMREDILIMRPATRGSGEIVYEGFEQRENAPTAADVVSEMQQGGYTIDEAKLQQAADRLNEAAVEMGFVSDPLDALRSFRDGKIDGYQLVERMPLPNPRPILLNVGSGQRRFESTPEMRCVNIDSQSVEPDRVPDMVCDVGREGLPFVSGAVKYVVLHQVLEHFGCGESTAMLLECWRVLARGGSLIITVPDMRKLAARWLGGELTTQVYMTSVYGAFMGDEADRHKWGGDAESWTEYLRSVFGGDHAACPRADGKCACNGMIRPFDWREIPGADIARDFWIAGIEVVKP